MFTDHKQHKLQWPTEVKRQCCDIGNSNIANACWNS